MSQLIYVLLPTKRLMRERILAEIHAAIAEEKKATSLKGPAPIEPGNNELGLLFNEQEGVDMAEPDASVEVFQWSESVEARGAKAGDARVQSLFLLVTSYITMFTSTYSALPAAQRQASIEQMALSLLDIFAAIVATSGPK